MPRTATVPSASDITDPNWRARPVLSLKAAANIAGISVSSLYRYQADGRLSFGRLGGRTLVRTDSLIQLIDSVEDWSASDQGAAARGARAGRAAAGWQS
jgi:hypothetical protein